MTSARFFLPIFLVLCLLLAACGDSSPTPANSPVPAAQPTPIPAPTPDPSVTRGTSQDEDAIKETLLRTQFEKDKDGGDPDNPFKAYCLGSGTTFEGVSGLSDAPQTLLDRFKGNTPPVVKASDCAMVGDGKAFTMKSVLKTTNEQVRFYAVSAVTWLSAARVELEVSHQGNQGDSGGQVFQLEKKDGKWQVTGFTRTWTA